MYNRDYFVNKAKLVSKEQKKMVVVAPYDEGTLKASVNAYQEGFVDLIFVGEKSMIEATAKEAMIDISKFELINASSDKETAELAAQIVARGGGDVLMKGLIDTSVVLKAVLQEKELRTGRTFSHVGVVYKEDSFYIICDAGINIAPTVAEKKQIIENALPLAHGLGIMCPKVAVLCAKEKPYDKMPATLDAQALKEMNLRGEITGCLVSGPLQMDIAVSKHAAEIKGIDDPVAGNAEILIAPTIEAANIICKGLEYLGGFKGAGFIAGAKIPIILMSRADGEEVKMTSIALAVIANA